MALASVLLTAGIRSTVDLTLGDDARHLLASRSLPWAEIFGRPSFLYTMWLKLVGIFSIDVADTYYSNISLLSMASTLAVFWYVRQRSFRVRLAMAVAFMWCITPLNVPLYDKSHLFAAVLVLAGFIAGGYCRQRCMKELAVAGGLLLASCVKQFYLGPSVFMAVLSLLSCRPTRLARLLPYIVFAEAAFLLKQGAWGGWLFDQPDMALAAEFRRAFMGSWNMMQDIPRPADSMALASVQDKIWRETFGAEAAGFLDAALKNPTAVFYAAGFGGLQTVRIAAEHLFLHYPVLLPTNAFRAIVLEGFAYGGAFCCLLALALVDHNLARKLFLKRHKTQLSWWLVAAAPAVFLCLVTAPDAGLALPICLIALIFGGLAIGELAARKGWLIGGGYRKTLAASVLMLLAVPRVYTMPPKTDLISAESRIIGRIHSTLPVRATARFVEDLELPPMRALVLDDRWAAYLPAHIEVVSAHGGADIKRLVGSGGVGMILDNGSFAGSQRQQRDLAEILERPASFGLREVKVPDSSDSRILLRDAKPKPAFTRGRARR
ncbi:hypothetical protein FACS1894186_3790 [Alphaproteobacteria bacterium]|nr:hypothetical protein FACS1894186_3790 [Alphaproteobacteria bacterium]